ncbi:hypothetical protein DFH06DRAFT_1150762 [Mycena polygramma]|nr:hypothetical protein DFH06DRAFT_1150762 [Mycena polygramma]
MHSIHREVFLDGGLLSRRVPAAQGFVQYHWTYSNICKAETAPGRSRQSESDAHVPAVRTAYIQRKPEKAGGREEKNLIQPAVVHLVTRGKGRPIVRIRPNHAAAVKHDIIQRTKSDYSHFGQTEEGLGKVIRGLIQAQNPTDRARGHKLQIASNRQEASSQPVLVLFLLQTPGKFEPPRAGRRISEDEKTGTTKLSLPIWDRARGLNRWPRE